VTPERAADVVMRWVRLYTLGLSTPDARRRIEEVQADLYDHITHARAHGVDDGRIGRDIASRMIRGLTADVSWRLQFVSRAAHLTMEEAMNTALFRSAVRVTVGVSLILMLPAAAMLFSDGVVWSLGDFVVAGTLLAVVGVAVELAVKKAGSPVAAVGIVALGVAAAVWGNADDAPGLVLLGLLLVAGGLTLGVRRTLRS
jgi:hypothetical protein